MEDTTEIRLALEDDLEQLAESNKLMAQETEGIELEHAKVLSGVGYLLTNPRHGFYVVAEVGGKFAGSLMVTKEWSDWRNGFFWWIQSVYVLPEYRQKGIYTKLYSYIKDLGYNDEKCIGFRLYVAKENENAKVVYKKLGMDESNYVLFEEEK